MVRDSAAEVLPFSQLGGMALGVRAAVLRGLATPLACASMIVDVTTEMVAQIGYVALGLAVLMMRAPRTSFSVSLTRVGLIGHSWKSPRKDPTRPRPKTDWRTASRARDLSCGLSCHGKSRRAHRMSARRSDCLLEEGFLFRPRAEDDADFVALRRALIGLLD